MFELFSGASGLGLGLHRVIPGLRTVGHVEREAYAASVIVARMAEALLDQAPIWDDVVTFDGRAWRGGVDLLAGGFPCQDISVAGKGAGLAGERSGLWSEFARIISEVRPRYVFIENVAVLKARGLDQVLSDLAALGFDAEWTCYRASDAGAPHRRDRIFILANACDGYDPRGNERTPAHARENQGPHGRGGSNRPRLANTCSDLLRDESGRGSWANGPGASVPGYPRPGMDWPPRPDDRAGWARTLAVRPDLEPAICRVANGLANRVERLRLLGNGVVPVQAAQAFLILWDRMINSAP